MREQVKQTPTIQIYYLLCAANIIQKGFIGLRRTLFDKKKSVMVISLPLSVGQSSIQIYFYQLVQAVTTFTPISYKWTVTSISWWNSNKDEPISSKVLLFKTSFVWKNAWVRQPALVKGTAAGLTSSWHPRL